VFFLSNNQISVLIQNRT